MGIFFIILSEAIYGTSNFIDKFLLDKYKVNLTLMAFYTGIVAFISSIIIGSFTGFYINDWGSILILILSGILTELFLVPYFKALSLEDTSRIVPLFQLIPVMVLIIGYFILGEKMSFRQYLGASFVIIAGFTLSVDKMQLGIFRLRKAFWFILIADLLVAGSFVLFKLGVNSIPFWSSLPYEGLGVAIGALVLALYPGNLRVIRKKAQKTTLKAFGFMTINEVIFIVARYTEFFAFTLIPVGLGTVIGSTQSLITLIYGLILSLWFPKILKEVINKKTVSLKLLATVMIFIGMYCLFI